MMPAARVLYASLDLLDRQLRDRHGVECGNVDDLELTRHDDGRLYVTAILSGPGVLLYRLGRRRLGSWIQRAHRRTGFADDADHARVPIELASTISASIDLAIDRTDHASFAGERWVGDHIISHIPGNDHDADQ
ncbi:MAG: hypothetical protein JWM12_1547 [Ilumatobacteraceae bacterium]|nr:hypothetical protein [Ilumatobacteraceae bacterium]